METKELEILISQAEHLLEAKKLLDWVYSQQGGYRANGPISDDLRDKLNRFYGFDDSE